mgnify:CR=1 FL=1
MKLLLITLVLFAISLSFSIGKQAQKKETIERALMINLSEDKPCFNYQDLEIGKITEIVEEEI